MKKKIILIIAVIAALAVVITIALVVAKNFDKFFDIDNSADVGMTDEKASDTSNSTVYLEEYWSAKKNNALTLAELYDECEALIKSGKKIIFEKNLFAEYTKLFDNSSLSEESESELSIKNQETADLENDTYILLIATISTCFEDGFYYRDHDYDASYNRQRDTSFFYSSDFREYGYSSAEEYYNAACDGECQWSDESYNISFAGKHIVSAQDNGAGENIYETIKAK